ncbi:unnamed protein product [Rangifer tarandus platyrhynchus]|uniref:Uncharacterized protein n=2 Tax=Rangifer tarandus platyrhynchus TaxID=3082113 RepID=A0ACB0E628_RANTA|nr:unnamed protein product [Rangifer tarandus platyrhynchus]CAI9695908.1 unnamed protein product [Rangifer tarandus platyrhynchus]
MTMMGAPGWKDVCPSGQLVRCCHLGDLSAHCRLTLPTVPKRNGPGAQAHVGFPRQREGIIKGPKMSKLLVSEKQRLRLHGSSEQKPDWRLATNHTAKLGAEPQAATLMESVSE